MSGPDLPKPPHIYHERQVRAMCALHTLNNLFQAEGEFDQKSLDELCFNLDQKWINEHKSFWGIGDYDVNVIQAALTTKGYSMVWFDKRLNPNELDVEMIFGFILNVPSKKPTSIFGKTFSSFSSQRHWYAIRDLPSPAERQQGFSHFYNLDSNLEQPRSIGNRLQLVHLIREQMGCADKQLFLVVTPTVSTTGSWRLPFPAAPTVPVYTERTQETATQNDLAADNTLEEDDDEPWT